MALGGPGTAGAGRRGGGPGLESVAPGKLELSEMPRIKGFT